MRNHCYGWCFDYMLTKSNFSGTRIVIVLLCYWLPSRHRPHDLTAMIYDCFKHTKIQNITQQMDCHWYLWNNW